MKIWIWEVLDRVSSNYHEGGGLAVIARDEAHARELIAASPAMVSDEEWSRARVYDLVGEPAPDVITFPDAGCC